VLDAALALARAYEPRAAPVCAVGFGRNSDRSLYGVRVGANDDRTLVLLIHNTHGGEGAVRFQLVEADRASGAILVPDVPRASLSVPHVGDVQERLRSLRHSRMVEEYGKASGDAWGKLADGLWTPKHTAALVAELWPRHREPHTTPDGTVLVHPGNHLARELSGCSDPARAYRRICAYLDNESEARERGDFTKDRDERLALGTGRNHKQRAWRWIADNT
jgi:hypothetical protein